MKIFLVVPTIRNLDFLKEWGGQFKTCELVIVEDHAAKEVRPPVDGFIKIHHFSWKDIQRDLGKNEWIFSRQNAGIRSYGFWKAHRLGADVIITLDDDCFPAGGNFLQEHLDNLHAKAPDRWFPTFPHPAYMYTRGFPYENRNASKAVISHGLWSNKMDMDAKTQIKIGNVNIPAYPPVRQFIPPGYFFPMSSMNLAFVREVTSLMYFPLMGKDPGGVPWGFDRFDDIWAGLFAKKIVDHLGLAVVNGSPFVEHRKASDPATNLIKEEKGIVVNEHLWKTVDQVELTSTSPIASYRELAQKVDFPNTPYFNKLREAMVIWIDLFDNKK